MTVGRYELQIRLQEANESAGTQVRLADVRYATNGIQVIGQASNGAEAIPVLAEALASDTDFDVRLAATRSLGRFRDLLGASEDDSPETARTSMTSRLMTYDRESRDR